MEPVITVENLRKTYGATVAVDGVSFEVYRGEIFGMVGPNGAGKTTTIECIEGLREPTEGRVRVLGLDPIRDRRSLLRRVGIQLQSVNLPLRLRVGEIVDLFASFYPHTADGEALLERFGLAEKRNTLYERLSGGQKQRLFIVLALLNNPDIVFLDELTTGLDPQARLTMWGMVQVVRAQGKTVFLTTHYMEEAEHLCDRVAIMNHGRIIALDTPTNLVRRLDGAVRVVFEPLSPVDISLFENLPTVSRVASNGGGITVYGGEEQVLVEVVQILAAQQVRFTNLRVERLTLEDVFLSIANDGVSSHVFGSE